MANLSSQLHSEMKILKQELSLLQDVHLDKESLGSIFVSLPYESFMLGSYRKTATAILENYQNIKKPRTEAITRKYIIDRLTFGKLLSNEEIEETRRKIKSKDFSELVRICGEADINTKLNLVDGRQVELMEQYLRERHENVNYQAALIEAGVLNLPGMHKVLKNRGDKNTTRMDKEHLKKIERALPSFDPRKRLETHREVMRFIGSDKLLFQSYSGEERAAPIHVEFSEFDEPVIKEMDSLSEELKLTPSKHIDTIYDFLKRNRKIERFNTFKVGWTHDEDAMGNFRPLLVPTKMDYADFSEIGGYKDQKAVLQNLLRGLSEWPDKKTSKFLERMHIILLAGERGTGKSSSILALINSLPKKSKTITLNKRNFDGDFDYLKDLASNNPNYFFLGEIEDMDVVGKDRSMGTGGTDELLMVDSVESFPKNLIIIGSTNRPGFMDSALLRPGRTNEFVYYPLPPKDDRREIIQVHERRYDISLNEKERGILIQKTDKLSGAEIGSIFFKASETGKSSLKDLELIAKEVRENRKLAIKIEEEKMAAMSEREPNSLAT